MSGRREAMAASIGRLRRNARGRTRHGNPGGPQTCHWALVLSPRFYQRFCRESLAKLFRRQYECQQCQQVRSSPLRTDPSSRLSSRTPSPLSAGLSRMLIATDCPSSHITSSFPLPPVLSCVNLLPPVLRKPTSIPSLRYRRTAMNSETSSSPARRLTCEWSATSSVSRVTDR